MIRNLTILVVMLMVTCVAVRAQSPSPTPKNPEVVSSGSISGKVVNENAQPLIGAAVFVRSLGSSIPGRRTTTDLEGTFRVNGLEPGLYTINANAPAYTTEPAPPAYYRLGDSVRLEMVRGGVISGVVMNALGEPVIGVRVRAIRIRDAKGETSKAPLLPIKEQTTDDRGIYRIYGLSPGTYLVSAGGSGGGVYNPTFNPYDSDIPTYAPSSTRDTAAEITLRAGEESTADIRYKGEPGYTISGNVKAASGNGAQVSLTSVSTGTSLGSAFQSPGSRGFALSGLADGEYKLIGQEFTMVQTSRTPLLGMSDVKRVTIKGANVTGVELIPKPVSSVSGRISLERTKAPECEGKRPPLLVETMVQALRHEKDSEDDDPVRMGASSAAVDEKGAFVLRNLRPGRFRFEPRFYARYWYLQSIAMNTAGPKPQKIDAAATWTAVKSGDQLTNITITLAEGAASIRGRLALAEGARVPPTGMVVYLIPAEPDKVEDVLRFFVTDVASDGTFTLNNLPPGKYLAFTQTNVDAQIATLTKLRQPEAALGRTKLRRASEAQKGEAQKTEIELKPCQNLADIQLKQ